VIPWAGADFTRPGENEKGSVERLDLMIVLFLLVLINILVAIGRQQKRAWVSMIFSTVSFLLLLVVVLFVIRMFT
jgi:glucan phosphoethanolaminetransferase (alkaline phosphatase superfamily)